MSQSKLTKEQKEYIVSRYKEGVGATTIAKELGYKTGVVSYYISQHIGARSHSDASRKYKCNNRYFKTIDTEEKAYWLGFIYADGYISKRNTGQSIFGVSLSSKDEDHLIKLNNSLQSTYPICQYQTTDTSYKAGCKYSRLNITSKELVADLILQGVLEHKTKILQPLNISIDLAPAFIRGYIDGDGCITRHMGKKSYTYAVKILGTKEMLDYIKSFVMLNDPSSKIKKYYKRHQNDEVMALDISGNIKVSAFLDSIYRDATIYMDRKYKRYCELKNMLHSRTMLKNIA